MGEPLSVTWRRHAPAARAAGLFRTVPGIKTFEPFAGFAAISNIKAKL